MRALFPSARPVHIHGNRGATSLVSCQLFAVNPEEFSSLPKARFVLGLVGTSTWYSRRTSQNYSDAIAHNIEGLLWIQHTNKRGEWHPSTPPTAPIDQLGIQRAVA
jgi:hypothetical protein